MPWSLLLEVLFLAAALVSTRSDCPATSSALQAKAASLWVCAGQLGKQVAQGPETGSAITLMTNLFAAFRDSVQHL